MHIGVPNQHASTLVGIAMALFAVVVGLYGGFRYITADAALRKDRTEAKPAVAAIAGSLVVLVIGLVVAANLFAFR